MIAKKTLPCVTCKKETLIKELYENSEFGTYSLKMICDGCARKIDDAIDDQQQEKCKT